MARILPFSRWRLLGLAALVVCLSMPAAHAATARTRRHAAHHAAARHAAALTAPSAPGQGMILVDNDSGIVLAQSNPDQPLHPASLTKTMTLLLTFEALDSGRLHIRDAVPISAHAADMAPSKIGLRPGQSIAAEDAIYAVAVHSANDIAVALAEKIGGSEPGFVAMMNSRASQLGMVHTHFINANGLPNPVQYSSARDMALLARYIIVNHPREYRYFSTRTFIYRGTVYQNHNHLMETYPGMDGLKTGYIQASGFNLIASAKHGDTRLIGVIFGGRSTAARNAQMAALLDWGFAHDAGLVAAAGPATRTAAAPATRTAAIIAPPAQAPAAGVPPAAVQADTNAAPATTGQVTNNQVTNNQVTNNQVTNNQGADGRRENWQLNAGSNEAAPAETAQGSTAQGEIGQGDSEGAADAAPVAAPSAPVARKASGGAAVRGPTNGWAVQLGAYDTPGKAQSLLTAVLGRLPASLRNAQPQTPPLQTTNGWVYRARLAGYTHAQAFAVCKRLADCMPVPPAPQ